MENNLILTLLILFTLIFSIILIVYKIKKYNVFLSNNKFLYKKDENFIDGERIKFFSSIKSGTNLWITKNKSLSVNDLESIKIIIMDNIKLNKKQFDNKTEISFTINDILFVLRLPMSFENYLKVDSGMYVPYESTTYDSYSSYDSMTSNKIQRIEFKEESNDLNLWDFMETLNYSSLFEINKDSFKLYEMIKI